MKNLFQAIEALRDFLSGGYGVETRETYPAPFFPGERSKVPLFSCEIHMMKFKEKTVSCVCVCVCVECFTVGSFLCTHRKPD